MNTPALVRSFSLVSTLCAAAWLATPATAATYYWDPNTTTAGFPSSASSGTWNTNAYWTTDATGTTGHGTYVAGSDVVFTAGTLSVANTVTISASVSANSINIQAGRWTFSGTGSPTLTIGPGGLSLAAAGGGNLSGTVGGNTTFNNTIAVLLNGSQTWTNNAANGTNRIIVNGNVAGNATTGNTNTLTLAGASTGSGFYLSGVVSDGAGGGKLGVTVNNSTTGGTNTDYTLSGTANTFTGQVNVLSGGLSFNSIADAGASSSLGAATGTDSVINLGSGTSTGGLTLSGPTGTPAASSSNRVINLAGTTGGGVIQNNSTTTSTTLTLTGGVTNAGGGNKTLTLGGTNTGTNVMSGVIADATADSSKTAVSKSGLSLWALNAANTYTGGTTISAGTLSVGSGGTLGADVAGNNISIAGGNLLLSASGNVGSNQNITISSSGGGIGVSYDPVSFPSITDNSGSTGGVFGINYTGTGGIGTVAGINALFTGSSSWFLGSFVGGSGTYTGTSLTAGTGSTYRLGGGGGALTIQNNILTGANNLLVGSTGGGSVSLSNGNTYTGTTTVQNGTLNVSSLNSVTGGASSSSLGAPTTSANGTITLGSTTNVVALNYTGSGETTDRILKFNGTTGSVTLSNSGTGAVVYTGTPVFSGNGNKTLFLGNSTDSAGGSVGAITNSTGTTSLTKAGLTNSTWILTGGSGNTYTGTTTVSGGVLQTGAVSDLGTSYVSLNGASGTQFGIWQTQGSLTRVLSTTANAANLNWSPNSGFAAKGGGLVLNFSSGAALTWGANGFMGAGVTPMVFGSSTADSQVELKNSFTLGNDVSNGFNRVIDVEKGTGGDSALISGVISLGVDTNSSGDTLNNGFVKAGAGTLILSGANTYTGTTTFSNATSGTLLINGNQTAATGAVTASTGNTLGGSGIIGGATTINSGAFLTPGGTEGGVAVLTFNSGLAMNGTATLQVLAAGTRGTDYDAIDLAAGSFTGTGTLVINFSTLLAGSSTLDLFGGAAFTSLPSFSSVVATGAYAGTFTSGGGSYTFTAGAQTLALSMTTGDLLVTGSIAVPEPSTWAALAGCLALAASCCVRRRRTAA